MVQYKQPSMLWFPHKLIFHSTLEHPSIQYNSKQRQASLLAQLHVRQKGHLIEKTTLP